jgi:hypothetical protein
MLTLALITLTYNPEPNPNPDLNPNPITITNPTNPNPNFNPLPLTHFQAIARVQLMKTYASGECGDAIKKTLCYEIYLPCRVDKASGIG